MWWTLATLVEPLSSATFLLRFQAHLVPITKPYSINKFGIICVLALGAFVAAAVGGVDPSAFGDHERPSVRVACFLGFVLFMNFKFLVVDVDVVSTDNHAVSRSIEYRVAWRQLQPFLILSMVSSAQRLPQSSSASAASVLIFRVACAI